MQGFVRISCFLLLASTVLLTLRAQNQPAAGGSSELAADYPRYRAGVLIQNDDDWTPVTNQNPAKLKSAHGIAASLSYGMVPVKIVAEYGGDHAPAQTGNGRPVVCLCHFVSLPGDPVLVRLHPKNGLRELDGGRMIVYPIAGGSKMADANKRDLIPADVSHPDPQVWLVRPQSPLEPGEYALMLGTQNMSIYPFTVSVPATHPGGANGTPQ